MNVENTFKKKGKLKMKAFPHFPLPFQSLLTSLTCSFFELDSSMLDLDSRTLRRSYKKRCSVAEIHADAAEQIDSLSGNAPVVITSIHMYRRV